MSWWVGQIPGFFTTAPRFLLMHSLLSCSTAVHVRMFVAARWKMALRFVASALVFESALSFRPVFQHQHVAPAKCGRFFSSPLKSSGSGARQPNSGLLGLDRLQAEGNRQRQRRRGVPPEQQPSLVVMLAGVEGSDSSATPAGDAGGVTRAGEAVGAPRGAAGDAPPPGDEQQVICLEI